MNKQKILKSITNIASIVILVVIVGSFYFVNSNLVSSVQTQTFSCLLPLRFHEILYATPTTCTVFNIGSWVFFVGIFLVIIVSLIFKKKKSN